MSETMTDPVLGTVRYRSEWSTWSLWTGRVWFTPKHGITPVLYADRSRPRTAQEQLQRGSATYLLLRQRNWEHRTDVARSLLRERHPRRRLRKAEIESLARKLKLVRAELFDDTSAGIVFDCPEMFAGQEIDCSIDPGGDFGHANLWDVTMTLSDRPRFREEDDVVPSWPPLEGVR